MTRARDLVVLTADKNTEFLIRAGIGRPEALGVRPIQAVFNVHPYSDGGARTSGVQILSRVCRLYEHALLVFDHEGSGTDESAIDLEARLDRQLATHWDDKAKTIVVDPELEAWVWGSDNALAQLLDWHEGVGVVPTNRSADQPRELR